MDTSVLYYYGDSIRWSFGFDNPNKAAVLFACLLPLAWMIWEFFWLVKTNWLKVVGVVFATVAIFATILCLFKTYSRGGILASVIAVAYVLFKSIRLTKASRPHVKWVFTGLMCVTSIGLLYQLGVGTRTLTTVTSNDASVGNRVILWRAGLQMAYENPFGVGSGNSGKTYMQWYQPTQMTTEYRTMVNSYLTILVEYGWLVFMAILFTISLFWWYAFPGKEANKKQLVVLGLRGCVLAFLVAGIFSTTMEEVVLWLLPATAIAISGLLCIPNRRKLALKSRLAVFGGPVLVCLIIFAVGAVISVRDPLRRDRIDATQADIGPRHTDFRGKSGILVIPDFDVLGPYYGKLLRTMSLELGQPFSVRVSDIPTIDANPCLLVAGGAIREVKPRSLQQLIMIAPVVADKDIYEPLFHQASTVTIFLPDIDEDGRTQYWEQVAADMGSKNIRTVRVTGVGIRVDWAWQEVINAIKNIDMTKSHKD